MDVASWREKKRKKRCLGAGHASRRPYPCYPVGGVLSVASRAASHGSVASEAVSGRCRLEQLRRKASPLAGLELGSVSGRKLCRWRRFQSTPDISLLGNWHQNIRWSLPLGKMTLCSDCFVVRAKKICFSNWCIWGWSASFGPEKCLKSMLCYWEKTAGHLWPVLDLTQMLKFSDINSRLSKLFLFFDKIKLYVDEYSRFINF